MRRLIPAAGYIRMSTSKQEDSPERQRQEIERLAQRDGYQVVRWYQDSGKTGTKSANRPEFQRMLADAKLGEWKAILVHEQSRFSREGFFEVMAHWQQLNKAGVSLCTTRRGKIVFDDVGSVITSVIDVLGARDESVKIADRCVGGLRIAVHRGQRLGRSPFAYDREIVDDKNELVRVVSFREKFRKPKGWLAHLVPSNDAAAVDAVRMIFDKTAQGWTLNAVTRALRETGVKPAYKDLWTPKSVKAMLINPAYCGDFVIGRFANGQFSRAFDGLHVVSDAHEAIVTRETFDRVQSILSSRSPRYNRRRSESYLLSGLVVCGHCGGPVSGSRGAGRAYVCNSRGLTQRRCAHCPSIKADWLERAVVKLILDNVCNSPAQSEVTGHVRRQGERQQKAPDKREAKLADIRKQIEKATRNVALIDDAATVKSVAAMISEWRVEEARLAKELGMMKVTESLSPLAKQVIADVAHRFERLSSQRIPELMQALATVVQSVVLTALPQSEGTERYLCADVMLKPGFGQESLHLSHWDIRPAPRYKAAVDHVIAQAPRPVRVVSLQRLLGIKVGAASQMMRGVRYAINEGLIERTEDNGYVAYVATRRVARTRVS